MKTGKRILSAFLALLLVLPAFSALGPVSSAAGSVVSSGRYAGKNSAMTWELTSDGTLTIRGTGEMNDHYGDGGNASPFSRRSDVKKLVIGEGVTRIGDSAFVSDGELTEVSLPSTLRSIGDGAFFGCGFARVRLPDGLVSIEYDAFGACPAMKEIRIPASVAEVGPGWADLEAFTVDTGSRSFTAVDGVLYGNQGKELAAYPGSKRDPRYSIPDGVSSIASNAFRNVRYTEEVFIPSSVTRLSNDCLHWSFGKIFYEGTEAQWDALAKNAVSVCGSEQHVYCNAVRFADLTPDTPIARGECGADGDLLTWELTYGGTLTIVGAGNMRSYSSSERSTKRSPFFSERTIKRIEIGDGVTSVGDYAFFNDDRLESVSLPMTLRSIGKGAFCFCGLLADIALPDGLTSVGESAFLSTSLGRLHIPASVVSIGAYAADNSGLETYTVDKANPAYTAVDGVLFTKDMKELCAYPDGKPGDRYFVPDGVEKIGKGAFHLLPVVNMLYLPLSVRELDIFSLMWGGGSVFYAGTEEQWDALIGGRKDICESRTKVYFGAAGIPAYADPDAPVASGECGVDGGNVSWTLSKDGALTFTGAGAMGAPTVAVPGSDEPASIFTPGALTDDEACLAVALGYASGADAQQALGLGMIKQQQYYSTLASLTFRPVKSIVVGKGITALADGALRGACADSVSLPASLTQIGDRAFADSHIQDITLPAGVTRIGEYSFADSTLARLTVESAALTAAPTAFENADHLRYIIINNDGLDFSGLSVPCGAEGFAFTKAADFDRYDAFRKIRAMLACLPSLFESAPNSEAHIQELVSVGGYDPNTARRIDSIQNADVISACLAICPSASADVASLVSYCRGFIRNTIGLDIQSVSDIYTPDGRFTDALIKAFRISYGVDLTDAGAGGDVFYAPVSDLLLLKEERGLTAVPWLTVKANCGSTPHAICVAAELPFEGLTHTFGDWYTVTPAGEHTMGEKERVCLCGKTQRNAIPPIGRHVWSRWTVVRAATEDEDGEKTRTCLNCDCGAVETAVIPAGSDPRDDPEPEVEPESSARGIVQFFLNLVNFFRKLFSKK